MPLLATTFAEPLGDVMMAGMPAVGRAAAAVVLLRSGELDLLLLPDLAAGMPGTMLVCWRCLLLSILPYAVALGTAALPAVAPLDGGRPSLLLPRRPAAVPAAVKVVVAVVPGWAAVGAVLLVLPYLLVGSPARICCVLPCRSPAQEQQQVSGSCRGQHVSSAEDTGSTPTGWQVMPKAEHVALSDALEAT